jgi:hypothetical protein
MKKLRKRMLATIQFRMCLPVSSLKNLKIKIHKTLILPVFYECETWFLTLSEEHRSSV